VSGYGIAYLPENLVEQHLASGRLVRVLDDWSPMFAGYYLYYPSRRQNSPAFSIIVDALRVSERTGSRGGDRGPLPATSSV
jgi:DNA-binding transcriptional LysR family regulator